VSSTDLDQGPLIEPDSVAHHDCLAGWMACVPGPSINAATEVYKELPNAHIVKL
jgi:hypothetical protein